MPKAKLHMRTETRPMEKRAGLTPEGAARLLKAGFAVAVEESDARAFPTAGYADVGCEIVPAGSWMHAEPDTFVFGLKELPEGSSPLRHRHIMFGHAYKGQPGASDLLTRFKKGGGTLLDLEYLVDETGRRVAAFGYWAGYAGAAVAFLALASSEAGITMPDLTVPRNGRDELGAEVQRAVYGLGETPRAIVVGMGRTGMGASDLCASLGIGATCWDLPETAHGGPFPEILAHDVFLNCVLAGPGTPVFVDGQALRAERRLAVIGDIACDPGSDFNPIPIYDRATTFADPVTRVFDDPPLDIVAIDNLPSLLPKESSADFESQLLPSLLSLDRVDEGVWKRANDTFKNHTRSL